MTNGRLRGQALSGKNKTPARGPAFRRNVSERVLVVVVPVVVSIVVSVIVPIMMALPIMPAVLATDVMTVDPVPAVIGPMARDPNHFPVARPIAGTMAVIGPIAYFNAEALRRAAHR